MDIWRERERKREREREREREHYMIYRNYHDLTPWAT
jgi:hypothetical protein